MAEFDLDAMRRARTDQQAPAEPHTMRFGGQVFSIPAIPDPDLYEGLGEFAYLLREGQRGDRLAKAAAFRPLYRALESVLGAEQWPVFKALKPTLADLMDLVGGLSDIWGVGEQGNSSASGPSSPRAGATLRQPSPPTTEPTSPEPSSAPVV